MMFFIVSFFRFRRDKMVSLVRIQESEGTRAVDLGMSVEQTDFE